MQIKEKIKEKLNQHKFTRRFLDYDFRTVIFTVFTLIITTGYAVFYAILGVALLSVWYGMLAWYYIMIVIMRSMVIFYHKKKSKNAKDTTELKEKITRAKINRTCGIIISFLTFPLSFAIFQIIAQKATFSHEGLMIYVSATYTTYKVVMTIHNLRKARKSSDMTVRAIRSINLADMLVSILALQTAMFNSFTPDFNPDIFNGVTGAVVCLSTVIIGIIMIANSQRTIKQIIYEEKLKNQ